MKVFQDVTANPLAWPQGWKRTRNPGRWRGGDHSTSRGAKALLLELDRLGAENVVVSTNLALRMDGLPRSNQRVDDEGVAVYFTLLDQPRVLACDRWDRVGCNLWAIAKHIESLRGQHRWGVGSIEQAFMGYAALPEASLVPDCWSLLGVSPGASEGEVRTAYRQLAKACHPDVGGDHRRLVELNRARDEALGR